MTKCSVIIPVFNKAALTKQCLDALFQVTGKEHEVIVADDASSDETQEVLAGYGSRLRVVSHGINTGFAGTCNDGAAAAREQFLVFLNNDTIPLKGWLDALVRYAESHPKAAAVGVKLLFPDDTIQHAGVIITQHRWPHHIYAGFPAEHPAVNKSRKFQIVTGGCMLVRREIFQAAGGFDTAFCNSYEDVDFCLRLGEMGHEVHYCHESVLYHLESRTRDTRSPQEIKNNSLYRTRWAERVRPDDFEYYIEDKLLALDYPMQYPIHFAVSPMVAIESLADTPGDTERILSDRSKQVYHLLQENLNLRVGAREAELERARSFEPENGSRQQSVSESAQKIVANGTIHFENNLLSPNARGAMPEDGPSGITQTEAAVLPEESDKTPVVADGGVKQEEADQLRKLLLEAHEQLAHRDRQLMRICGLQAGATSDAALQNTWEEYRIAGIFAKKNIGELMAMMDDLDDGVVKIYQTRRWKFANPISTFGRMFMSSLRRRGYWRLDDVLARYKEWKRKNPECSHQSENPDVRNG